ncbi:hypothetical protein WN48_10666 [Eufriesea mexicana]|uniref:Zonadhesin n=1 Tax=Eufriesea mexicana TaxID=516756 RepID=A0A310S8Y7_9HYME|nr:hypothetical protein WN48_10666 [Eufriesea mexicana]
MQLRSCFAFLLLGLAVSQAVPAEEKKLETEEIDNDTDRSKNIQPGAPAVQTLSIQTPQPVQTFNIQPALQRVKTFNIQAPQSVQALSIQPGSSSVQTLSIQRPQVTQSFSIRAPQPVSTVSIQPVQHSPQTNVNILQPTIKEINPVPVVQKIIHTEKIVESAPKSETVVVSEVEKEVVAPVAPVYREQVVVNPRYPCIVLSEPGAVPAYVKCPKLKYGPKTLSALSKMLVEQPVSVLTRERALFGAA